MPMTTNWHFDAAQQGGKTFALGGSVVDGSGDDAAANMVGNPYKQILLYGHTGVQPNFELQEPTADTAVSTLSYVFQWLAYEIENSLDSRLFWFDGL